MIINLRKLKVVLVLINVVILMALVYALFGGSLYTKEGEVVSMRCTSSAGKSSNLILNIGGIEYWKPVTRTSCTDVVHQSENEYSYAEIKYLRKTNYISSLKINDKTIYNGRVANIFSFIWWCFILFILNRVLLRSVKRSRFVLDEQRSEKN